MSSYTDGLRSAASIVARRSATWAAIIELAATRIDSLEAECALVNERRRRAMIETPEWACRGTRDGNTVIVTEDDLRARLYWLTLRAGCTSVAALRERVYALGDFAGTMLEVHVKQCDFLLGGPP